MLHIGCYADDLAPSIGASVAYAFAERVFVRKVTTRHRLADNDDFGRVLAITFGKFAPGHKPHSHRSEIIRAYGAIPRDWLLIGLRRRTAFDHEGGVSVESRERKRRSRRGRLRAGQRPDAFQKLAVKRSDLITFGVRRLRQRHDGGQDIARVETRINALKLNEASDQ